MAVTDPYAQVSDYSAVFPIAPNDDVELLRQLTVVSRYIDHETGRFFTKDAAAVARIYIPREASDTLWTEDIAVSPTSLKIDTDDDGSFADETAITGFELLPLNAARGPEVQPWHGIRLRSFASPYTVFPANTRVEVTAQWGWLAVPEAIRQATIQLTAILRLQSPRATNSIDEMGRVIGMSSEGRGIVEDLKYTYCALPAVF